MKKKGNIIKLVLIALIFLVGGYTVLFGIGGYGSAKNIILGLDVRGGVSITYEVADETFTASDFADTKSKLESRAQALSTEAEVYQEGDRRIVVNIPGETDAEATLDKLGQPGSISFVTYESDGTEKVWLEGEDIQTARAGEQQEELTGATNYVVELTMSGEGAQKFEEATTENLNQIIYIVYDGEIISQPVVNSVISGGQAVIENIESAEEAEYLATMIRIGNLKLQLNTISHKTVGARLGAEALSKSIMAGLIGLLLICVFMIIIYRIPGVVASFALFFYTMLVMLALNGFNFTLTLPGIAGIILGIGMAVDANVIIYTRIREELADGQPVETAIKTGFNKANSAIIDGNVTTLIAAFVLMWQGSGTVQGFAQTLAVGILVSMFTALVVSRIIMMALYRLGLKDPKYYGIEKSRKRLYIVNKKKIFFAVSCVIIVVGFAIGGMNAGNGKGIFNTSIEFQGGKALTADFDKAYTIDEFNAEVKPAIEEIIGSTDVQAQKETNSNRYTIKMKDVDESLVTSIKETLINDFGAKEDNFEESYISATISNEMTRSAIIATILATICMLLYIWIRFSNVRFAFSAVIALIHDVVILLVFYMVSRTSVGTAFIACVLTIVGYSINATIVIFDRIRENLKANIKKRSLEEIIDDSITQTLTRTINTSLTTFVTVLMIFVLGVPSIQEFTLPIMVGIIAGGYSSVFITGPLLHVMGKKVLGAAKAEKSKTKK
ncbi:MAG: protein translocase subunit SecD [Clostridiales bacterium]|nr:protein translocase subunit SecD [Clostridiales bacterium]